MITYAKLAPDSFDSETAEWIATYNNNRGNCLTCNVPMYATQRNGRYYMACMPGHSHLYEECKKMEKDQAVYDLSHINCHFFDQLMNPENQDMSPPTDGNHREPAELRDTNEDEISIYKSRSLAVFERHGLHLVKNFPFPDGEKLVEKLLSSHTMEEFCNNYSLYYVNQRVIAAEPVTFSYEGQWIQYALRFESDGDQKQFRFCAVYEDIDRLNAHIRRLFDKEKRVKKSLVYVCADWSYIGSPNTPLKLNDLHCCTYCRMPDSGDPGCAFDTCQCMGVYIGKMVNAGRQMRIIKENTPISGKNSHKRRKIR